uniref:Uncharacterized protein n=1 Tax=Panagrolaimus sp. ES5 TaxID=591445 RepID=A0AC34G410_9BILA
MDEVAEPVKARSVNLPPRIELYFELQCRDADVASLYENSIPSTSTLKSKSKKAEKKGRKPYEKQTKRKSQNAVPDVARTPAITNVTVVEPAINVDSDGFVHLPSTSNTPMTNESTPDSVTPSTFPPSTQIETQSLPPQPQPSTSDASFTQLIPSTSRNAIQKIIPVDDDIQIIEPDIEIVCENVIPRNGPRSVERNVINSEINGAQQPSTSHVAPPIPTNQMQKTEIITEGAGNEEADAEGNDEYGDPVEQKKIFIDPAIIRFLRPAERKLLGACKKLKLKYEPSAFNWWGCNININVILSKLIHAPKIGPKVHGFDCLSIFLTGSPTRGKELWTNFNLRLNKDEFLKAQYNDSQRLKMSHTFCEEHFTIMARWLCCQIGIYDELWNLIKFGDWSIPSTNDFTILILKQEELYAPILQF